MSYRDDGTLKCDGAVYRVVRGVATWDRDASCASPVSHIDDKGWLYCASHGESRRSQRPCRKLRPHELNKLKRGEQLSKY